MKKRKIYSKEFKLEALRQWEQLEVSSARAVGILSEPSPAVRCTSGKSRLSDLFSTDLSSGAESGRHDHQA